MSGALNSSARAALGGATHGRSLGHSTAAGGCASTVDKSTTGGTACQLRAASGKVVARIDGDTLRKTVDGERHYLQRPHGLAFDLSILQEAEKAGCVLAVVYDKAIGATYRAALADFAVHGVKLDRGFGLQVCLPLAFWRCERRGEPRQLAFAGLGA